MIGYLRKRAWDHESRTSTQTERARKIRGPRSRQKGLEAEENEEEDEEEEENDGWDEEEEEEEEEENDGEDEEEEEEEEEEDEEDEEENTDREDVDQENRNNEDANQENTHQEIDAEGQIDRDEGCDADKNTSDTAHCGGTKLKDNPTSTNSQSPSASPNNDGNSTVDKNGKVSNNFASTQAGNGNNNQLNSNVENDDSALVDSFDNHGENNDCSSTRERNVQDDETAAHKRKKNGRMSRLLRVGKTNLSVPISIASALESCAEADAETVFRFNQQQSPTSGDYYTSFVCYTMHVEQRQQKDRYRWLFVMLGHFDQIRILKPDAKGRMGREMMRGYEVVICSLLNQKLFQRPHICDNIGDWVILGAKLHGLCEAFGEGCLFVLGESLSRDFLEHKYASTGSYHDAVFGYLDMLDLKAYCETTGLTLFGKKIRAGMSKPFREARDRMEGGGTLLDGSS
ncbi:MAG: hypothetical protein Q9190_000359 [Brigantiaea leucoxantha]